ncbi:hypothetical protein [Pyxidicoccus trucidator]|uniref:hypothetical protein n=1 Tax=Pyxidicoccus trucidator TaxID=2709662 RepID=UPI0013DD6965|nr:hypothetical protein [Pyxidicoccus trucidator]
MSGHFKFVRYDSAELTTAGKQLVDAMIRGYDRSLEPPTEAWTELVLDWFACAAGAFSGQPVLVDARAREVRADWRPFFSCLRDIPMRTSRAEFLLDLTHSTYPDYIGRYYKDAYWDECLLGQREVLLGLESEWGRCGDVRNTRVKVLEEAVKLAAIRARTKVLVFGSNDTEQCARLIADVALLRYQVRDETPWLLVDVPWRWTGQSWQPSFDILKGTERPAHPLLRPTTGS